MECLVPMVSESFTTSQFRRSRFATLASIVVSPVERAELKVAVMLIAVNTKPTRRQRNDKEHFVLCYRSMVKREPPGIVLEGK
jgi:hypothetical protein